MNKLSHYLKVFGLSFLGGILGGIIHIAAEYFLTAPKLGYIFVSVGALCFYWYFTKPDQKKYTDIPVGIIGCWLSIAITQFFDLMFIAAQMMVGEEGYSLLKKTFLIYKYNYYTVSSADMQEVITNASIYQELILLIFFSGVFLSAMYLILHFSDKNRKIQKKKTQVKKSYKIGGNKK